MSAHSDHLTETMTQQRMISDQSARELAPLLDPDQRALVSLIATAELHQLDLKSLLHGFAKETRSVPVKEFSERMIPGADPLEIASGVNGLLPLTCKTALTSAQANGSLHSFYRSWLAQTVNDRVTWVRHEDTHVAAFGRLGIRTVICLYFISVILLFVVPEQLKILGEFGIDPTPSMKTFMYFGDWFAKLFFPFVFLFGIGFCVYLIGFKRSFIKDYFRRWLPGSWRKTELPRVVLRRKLMAWDLLAFEGSDMPEKEIVDWDAFVAARELSSREVATMKEASSMETKAWLLRNMADQKHESRKNRFAFAVHSIIFVCQAILAIFIILATFSTFSMMIRIMRDLG